MITAIIILSIAFLWLLYETRWLTIRLGHVTLKKLSQMALGMISMVVGLAMFPGNFGDELEERKTLLQFPKYYRRYYERCFRTEGSVNQMDNPVIKKYLVQKMVDILTKKFPPQKEMLPL